MLAIITWLIASVLLTACSASDKDILQACERLQETGQPIYLESVGLDTRMASEAFKTLKKSSANHFITDCHQLVKNLS